MLRLTFRHHVEMVVAVLISLILLTAVDISAGALGQSLAPARLHYDQTVAHALGSALQTPTIMTTRSCFDSPALSPCARIVDNRTGMFDVVGPNVRVVVRLPFKNVNLAVTLKQHADALDQATLPTALGALKASDTTGAGNVMSTIDVPSSDHFRTVVVQGTALGFYQNVGSRPTGPSAMPSPHPMATGSVEPASSDTSGVWWFTVPSSMLATALVAMNEHPIDTSMIAQP